MQISTRFSRIPGADVSRHAGRRASQRGSGERDKHTAEDRKLLRLIAKLRAELRVEEE